MKYLATVNTPGYSPWDDDPPTFDTAKEAWEYLADERQRAEEDLACDETCDAGPACQWSYTADLSDTFDLLKAHADEPPTDGQGTVVGDTPGYHGDHDLGKAYTVTAVGSDEAIDVWLRVSDDEDHSDFEPLPSGAYPAEANTFHTATGYRVDWSLTAVGLVTSRTFTTLPEAHAWLESEGFANYSS